MRVLMNMHLSDRSARSFIEPLTKLSEIKEIDVVRDIAGTKLSKVKYFSPIKILIKISIIKLISKFFILTYLALFRKPDFMLGVHLYFHGIVIFLVAKITRKPVVISLIAGTHETQLYGKFFERLFINMLNHCDFITVTGTNTKNYLIKKGMNKNKIVILPSVIDMKQFKLGNIKKTYDIISIGRLVKVKNLDTLLKIISKIKKEYPNITVGIAGDGPCKEELEKLCGKLKLTKNVKFLGYTSDANSILNSGKIFVLTSKHEGFPLALLEAMACGLPSVVSDVGDIKDVAINDVNSFVVDNCNEVNAYVNAISRLLKDKKVYNKLSKNALKIKNTNSIENSVKIWKRIKLCVLTNSKLK